MPTSYEVNPESSELSNNAIVAIDAFMRQSEFYYKYDVGVVWCGNHKAENLLICHPSAVILRRVSRKRLNSPFCKSI
ncbi:hypothetical protein [Bartonella phoceensis]|uniref:hypothetical protein n=1 Tax=Bartonella phoceensis TaxID=270249 RepID=UPI001FE61921|nr:hypothetical protein [Bartonella phoceensis]